MRRFLQLEGKVDWLEGKVNNNHQELKGTLSQGLSGCRYDNDTALCRDNCEGVLAISRKQVSEVRR